MKKPQTHREAQIKEAICWLSEQNAVDPIQKRIELQNLKKLLKLESRRQDRRAFEQALRDWHESNC
jgi:hypothetical protein